MTSDSDIHGDIALSILEHADAIGRLDRAGMGPDAYDAAVSTHVSAMRLMAVPHMDPQPDRQLVRKLGEFSGRTAGVHVRLAEGAILVIVDGASRQHTIRLWNREQFERGEEDEDVGDG